MTPAQPLYVPKHAQCTELSLLSSDGKTQLALYRYTPSNVPVRAAVQIVHGMTEYFYRYTEVVDVLCEQGYEVWGDDHLGHGNTVKDPKDFGYFADKDGDARLSEDEHLITGAIRAAHPDLPIFIMGHSMGSFIARDVTAKWGNEYAGAVYVGTAGPGNPTGAGIFVADLIGLFRGKHHRSKLIKQIGFNGYLKTYEKGCSPAAWITTCEDRLAAYEGDPYCDYIFTVRAYRDMFKLLGRVSAKDWAGKIPQDLPVLLLAGDDDPVGQWGKGVEIVRDRLKNAGVKDVTCNLYEKDRHEVLNEKDCDVVRADLVKWLNDRV